jgi:hypothetical protein
MQVRREKNRNREFYYQERNATAGRETEKGIKERTERTEELKKNVLQKERKRPLKDKGTTHCTTQQRGDVLQFCAIFQPL